MDKQNQIILKEIEKINQEILILSQRVSKLEKNMLRDQVKISPYNNMPRTSNLDKIVESAEIAMKRFTKRMNDEG